MTFYRLDDVGTVHIKFQNQKDAPPHCRAPDCGRMGDLLCDYPVGDGKTCDAPLCKHHGQEVAPDTHYCPAHHIEWQKFVDEEGVRRALSNVVPFKT